MKIQFIYSKQGNERYDLLQLSGGQRTIQHHVLINVLDVSIGSLSCILYYIATRPHPQTHLATVTARLGTFPGMVHL